MNSLQVIGRVGRDAEVRPAGDTNAMSFPLAVNVGFGAKKQTVWFDCTLWGIRGAALVSHVKKGDQVGVSGELGTREHDGKTYLTLRVADVTLCGGKPAPAAAAANG